MPEKSTIAPWQRLFVRRLFPCSASRLDIEGGIAAKNTHLLLYPAAFAYRHGIELYLKHLVFALNTILETGRRFEKNHKMIDLWKDVVGLHATIGQELIEPKAIARAGELIGYFDAFDPTGQVFRYPEDIKGNRHLAEHKLINVEVLRDQMAELREILECWVYQAADHRDWQIDQIKAQGAERARG